MSKDINDLRDRLFAALDGLADKKEPMDIERARANPCKIKNGNDQPGGSSFIAIALYEKMMNFKVTRVSYAGFGPTVIGLMAGEVDSATVPIPDTIEQHKAGKLKILGVSATERHFMAPDIPTFREQGHDVVVGAWRCIVGPKGIPEDRLRFLAAVRVVAVHDDPQPALAVRGPVGHAADLPVDVARATAEH